MFCGLKGSGLQRWTSITVQLRRGPANVILPLRPQLLTENAPSANPPADRGVSDLLKFEQERQKVSLRVL